MHDGDCRRLESGRYLKDGMGFDSPALLHFMEGAEVGSSSGLLNRGDSEMGQGFDALTFLQG